MDWNAIERAVVDQAQSHSSISHSSSFRFKTVQTLALPVPPIRSNSSDLSYSKTSSYYDRDDYRSKENTASINLSSYRTQAGDIESKPASATPGNTNKLYETAISDELAELRKTVHTMNLRLQSAVESQSDKLLTDQQRSLHTAQELSEQCHLLDHTIKRNSMQLDSISKHDDALQIKATN
jgi:hypothetical protein